MIFPGMGTDCILCFLQYWTNRYTVILKLCSESGWFLIFLSPGILAGLSILSSKRSWLNWRKFCSVKNLKCRCPVPSSHITHHPQLKLTYNTVYKPDNFLLLLKYLECALWWCWGGGGGGCPQREKKGKCIVLTDLGNWIFRIKEKKRNKEEKNCSLPRNLKIVYGTIYKLCTNQ